MKVQKAGQLFDQSKDILEHDSKEMYLSKEAVQNLVVYACTNGQGFCPQCGQKFGKVAQ